MNYLMTKVTKQYSQIFDEGIKSGIIAQIGEKILALLAAAILFGPWMIESFSDFIWNLWSQLPDIAPH